MSRSDATRIRTRIETGIYQRDGRYQVLVSDQSRVTFKTARTLTEARALRGDILAKRAKGQRVLPSERRTLGQAIDEYLSGARLRPNTRTLYEHNLRREVVKRLYGRKLPAVTIDDVARLVRSLEADGLAGPTIRNVLIALSSVFSLGVRREWCPSNPVRGLTTNEQPSKRTTRHRVLTPEEIARVLASAGAWRTLVAVSLYTGVRQGELIALRWRDLDLTTGRLHVSGQLERRTLARVAPKTEQAVRDIVLPGTLITLLREARLRSPWSLSDHPVFTMPDGKPLAHRYVIKLWDRVRRRAQLADPLPRFHDLRHTAASMMVADAEGDVAYVSRQLGHSSLSITLDTYAGEFDAVKKAETVRDRMERRVAEAFGGTS